MCEQRENGENNGQDLVRDKKTGRFLPGNKGGGRKPLDANAKAILEMAAPKAARYLVELIDDDTAPAKLRLRAAEVLLERVYGKPKQEIDANVNNSGIMAVAFEGDLDAWSK